MNTSENNVNVAAEETTSNEVVMTYQQLRDEVLKRGLVVENQKKETLIAALEADMNIVQKGRPVDPNSARQKRLAEHEARKAAGELRRGRPVDPDSARQKTLAERTAAEGERRGRPIDPNSKAQQKLAAKQALIASGVEVKRGRPAGTGKKKDDVKASNTRYKIVITNKETGEQTNFNKSFANPKTAMKEMREAGVEAGSYKLEEFVAAGE
jgi:hypothetical protein